MPIHEFIGKNSDHLLNDEAIVTEDQADRIL